MSDSIIFYTHPRSRGQIVRWMLEEVGAPYDTVVLDFATTMKSPDFLAINPMGKVPAITHGATVVTEGAAICAYLADAFAEAGLAPPPAERADYYRWLFFVAGPVEAAFSNRAMGWEVPPERRVMMGYGNFDLAIAAVETALKGKTFIAGNRFSAADIYVASVLDLMIRFRIFEPSTMITDYISPLLGRAACRRARDIDAALVDLPA